MYRDQMMCDSEESITRRTPEYDGTDDKYDGREIIHAKENSPHDGSGDYPLLLCRVCSQA